MFTAKGVLVGLVSVCALFVAMFIYRALASVSTTRTSGRGAILGQIALVIASPAFWISAGLIFFAVVFLVWKQHALGHS